MGARTGEARSERARTRFPDFYAQTFRDLSLYARSITGDAHVADELAQEALSRVYARWSLLREPRPYAFRIVRNLSRDRWTARSREQDAWQGLAPTDHVDGPDATTMDAVRRLPGPLREVVLLHYYADLPIHEVARVLRRPEGTVKHRLYDARAALATMLEETR